MDFVAILAYMLVAIFTMPFLAGFVLVIYWNIALIRFNWGVKKVNPDLAFSLFPFFQPRKGYGAIRFYGLGFKMIWHELSFGFLSKEKTEKLLDEFFNIKAVRKLNKADLNKQIERLLFVHRIFSYGFMAYLLLIIAAGILMLLYSLFIQRFF